VANVTSEHYECPNCGANLDPSLPSGHEVYTVRCEYCGKKMRIKQEPAPARGSPAERQPRLRVERVRPRPLLFVIIGLAVVLPLVGGLAICGLASRGTDVARRLTVGAGAGSATAAYPLRCSGSEQLTLSDETVRQTGTIVEASGSCKVSISSANLTSDAVAIIARGSAEVSISNTSLNGAVGAITAAGRARVVVDNSTVQSRGTAVHAAGTAEVSLSNSRLSGDKAAYATKGKGKVSISGTSVTGPVPSDAPQP
jgi:DNA-directed RNA polymerase subunit RPC12/RpoP